MMHNLLNTNLVLNILINIAQGSQNLRTHSAVNTTLDDNFPTDDYVTLNKTISNYERVDMTPSNSSNLKVSLLIFLLTVSVLAGYILGSNRRRDSNIYRFLNSEHTPMNFPSVAEYNALATSTRNPASV
jgi:hypothetical protein